MEGATRSSMSYIDKLEKFHRQQGTTLNRLPQLNNQPIDLYQLKRAVDTRGGFKSVCDNRQWADVARELGYANTKNIAGASTTLRSAYQRYQLPYETYLEKAKPDFLREMGLTPSPQQEKTSHSTNTTPLSMRRNLTEQIQKPDERIDEIPVDSVKRELLEPRDRNMKDVTPTPSRNGLKRPFGDTIQGGSSDPEKEPGQARRESKRIKGSAFRQPY